MRSGAPLALTGRREPAPAAATELSRSPLPAATPSQPGKAEGVDQPPNGTADRMPPPHAQPSPGLFDEFDSGAMAEYGTFFNSVGGTLPPHTDLQSFDIMLQAARRELSPASSTRPGSPPVLHCCQPFARRGTRSRQPRFSAEREAFLSRSSKSSRTESPTASHPKGPCTSASIHSLQHPSHSTANEGIVIDRQAFAT